MDINKPIPRSLISTKVLLDAYVNLREISNGECTIKCPRNLSRFGLTYHTKRRNTFCSFCLENWCCDGVDFLSCPCNSTLTPKEIFLRLDEVIDQLRKKLKKEFSS